MRKVKMWPLKSHSTSNQIGNSVVKSGNIALFMIVLLLFSSSVFAAPIVRDEIVEFHPYQVLPKGAHKPAADSYLLSYDEYLALLTPPKLKDEEREKREEEKRKREKQAKRLQTVSFTNTVCSVDLGAKRARIKLEGTYIRRAKGWDEIILLQSVGSAFLREARCNGEVISAQTNPRGELVWQTKQSGKLKFTLKLTSLIDNVGRYGFKTNFPVFKSPVNSLSVKTKEKRAKEWRVRDESRSGAKVSGLLWTNGKGQLQGSYEPSRHVTLAWKVTEEGVEREKEVTEEERRAPQVSYHFAHYIRLNDDHYRGRGLLEVEIEHQPLGELSFIVPTESSLLDIRGPMLREWFSTPCPQGRRVVLKLTREFLGKLKFDFSTHGVHKAGKVARATISLPMASESYHERNLVALDAASHIELKVSKRSSLVRPLDGSKFPAKKLGLKRGALHACYSTSRHPAYTKGEKNAPLTIDVEVKKHTKAAVWTAVVDLVDVVTMVTSDSYIVTRITYHVKNNSEQFLKVDLPEKDVQVLTTFVSHKAVIPARGKDGQLLVPLERSTVRNTQANAFAVELTYLRKIDSVIDAGQLILALPRINLVASTVRWTVRSPKGYKFVFQSGTVREDPTYRKVDYLGQDEQRAGLRPKTLRIFDTTTLPLRVRLPEGAPTFYYSADLVSPADSPPALVCSVLPLMVGRLNKKAVFMAATLLSLLLLFGFEDKRRSYYAAGIMMLASGLSLGAISHIQDELGLGMFFALGVFFGVTAYALSQIILLESEE